MMEFLAVLAVFISDMLGRFRRWLTFRRALGIVAILVLLLCVRGLIEMGMGADLPILFGLDWGLALEVSALMIALSARHQMMAAVYMVRRGLVRLKPIGLFLRRGVRRAFRSRPAQSLLPPPPDDEPAAFAMAW